MEAIFQCSGESGFGQESCELGASPGDVSRITLALKTPKPRWGTRLRSCEREVTWIKDLAREAKVAEECIEIRGSVNQIVGTSRVSKPRWTEEILSENLRVCNDR
jgi:hypothetical protein